MTGSDYARVRFRCFEKTGCLITADGLDDHRIQPEGLSNYVVPPPLPIVTGVEVPCPVPLPSTASEEELQHIEEAVEPQTDEDEETTLVDLAADRVMHHVIVGRKVRFCTTSGAVELYPGTTKSLMSTALSLKTSLKIIYS